MPYQPFIEAMGAAAPWLRGDGITMSGDAVARRYELFGQTSQALDRIVTQWPVLLVLDDLHWADRPSLQLLRHLSRRPGPNVVLLGAFRETELERDHLLADLTGDPAVTCVQLQGLTAPEVASLVVERGSTGLGTSSPSFIEQLRVVTNGNPFFIDQVLRHLRGVRRGRQELA